MALEGKSPHRLDSGYSGSEQGYRWISLPLAKPVQSNPVHLANEISASQANQMLKRKEVERAFLGIIRLVEEE